MEHNLEVFWPKDTVEKFLRREGHLAPIKLGNSWPRVLSVPVPCCPSRLFFPTSSTFQPTGREKEVGSKQHPQ